MTVQINGSTGITTPAVNSATPVIDTKPAFSAYLSANQSVSNSTFTKIRFDAKEFDTANAFDNITNFRFQPAVAGYYQASCAFTSGTSTITQTAGTIYKNGVAFKVGTNSSTTTSVGLVSTLVFLNGSTDYLEAFAFITATTPIVVGGVSNSYFQAILVRTQ